MTIAALIVAAGRGTRAGGDLPKQWQPLGDVRVIDHTVLAFQRHARVGQIVVVLHPADVEYAKSLEAQGITLVMGGADRASSVRNGLDHLRGEKAVLIHDAARPCVCLLYTSPSPRDRQKSRMPSSA